MRINSQPHFSSVYLLSENHRNTGSKWDPKRYERRDPVTGYSNLFQDDSESIYGIDGNHLTRIKDLRRDVENDIPDAWKALDKFVKECMKEADTSHLTELSQTKGTAASKQNTLNQFA